MKSELGLGVLFTGRLDPSFDAAIKKIKDGLGALEGSTKKVTDATVKQKSGILSLQGTLRSYITDVEKLLAIQARWYGAKAALFAMVDIPVQLVKQGLAFTATIDEAEKKLRRYSVMLGETGEEAKKADHELVLLARHLNLQWATPFEDIILSADRLRAAGVDVRTIMGGVLEDFTKFQTAWPEVEMDKFTKAVVGMVNTYRNMPGFREMTTDAERYKVVLDKLTVAMGVGVIEPKDLPQIMQHFGQMSQSIALSVDEMMALSVLVTNLGSKAGPAARALRGLSSGLVQEDKIKLLKQLGIEINKNLPLGRQLLDIIGQLRDKLGTGEQGLSAGASTILGKLVSVERVQPLIALMREFDQYKEILGDIQKSEGANTRSAEEMNTSLKNQWALFIKLIKEIGTMLYQSEELGRVLSFLKEVVRTLGLMFLGWSTILKSVWLLLKWVSLEIYLIADGLVKLATFNWRGIVQNFRDLTGWRRTEQEKIVQQHNESYNLLMGNKPSMPSGSYGPGKGTPPPLEEVPELPSTKNVYPSLIASERSMMNSRIAIQKEQAKIETALLENAHKLKLVTDNEYYARKFFQIDRERRLENEILDEELKEIRNKYAEELKIVNDTNIRKKIIAAQKADEEKIKVKRSEADGKAAIDRSNLETAIEQKNIDISKTSSEHYYNLLEILRGRDTEGEQRAIERKQALNEELFSRNLIGAEEYYRQEMDLVRESRDAKLKDLEETFNLAKRKNLEAQSYYGVPGGISLEELYVLQNKLMEIQEKYKSDVIKLNEEATKELNAIWWNYSHNIEAIYSEHGILGVVRNSLDTLIREFQNYGSRWKSFTDILASGLADSFETLFTDAMKLQFKSLEDYFNLFVSGIQSAMAKLLADEITMQFLKFVRSRSYLSGGSLAGGQGAGTYSNGTLGPYASGVFMSTVQHSGLNSGLTGVAYKNVPSWLFAGAPRLHSGLGAGEFPAILQRGETVTKRGGPDVQVNIQNETGSQIEGKPTIDFDAEKMIVGIVLKNVQRNGPLRSLLRK